MALYIDVVRAGNEVLFFTMPLRLPLRLRCGSVPRISVRKPIRLERGQKLAGKAV